MRVVALLVVACGCLAQPRTGFDAAAIDVAAVEVPDEGADTSPGSDASGAGCQLLASTCPNKQGCYPFPFEGVASGATRCAFQGVAGPSVPCQSQLECDGLNVCSTPGEPDAICLERCSLADPRCPIGSSCVSYRGYPGVGVCL